MEKSVWARRGGGAAGDNLNSSWVLTTVLSASQTWILMLITASAPRAGVAVPTSQTRKQPQRREVTSTAHEWCWTSICTQAHPVRC